VPRRFELGIGPLLARLGLTRPDQNPLDLTDELRPMVLAGDYRYAAVSPGSRVCWITAAITTAQVGAVGNRAILVFDPPTEGCWLRSVQAQTDAGSFAGWATTNQVGLPAGIIPLGQTQRGFRPDDREPYPTMPTPLPGSFPGANPVTNRMTAYTFPAPAAWFQGIRLFVVCETVNEGMMATIEFETPLEGMHRVLPPGQ
jgi:hypothetical protein